MISVKVKILYEIKLPLKEILLHTKCMHGEAMSCPDCNKKFGSTYTLETHRQNVHTDKSVKPFLCGQCTFATHSKGQEISEGMVFF